MSVNQSSDSGWTDTVLLHRRPTQRAPDAGESALFSGSFQASAFFHSDGVPPSAPALVTPAVRHLLFYH